MRTPTSSRSTTVRSGRYGSGTTGSRSTPKATRSSSRSVARPTLWRRLRMPKARSLEERCESGRVCIPGSRSGRANNVGIDVHRAARIAAAGHGGQVLLSQATADLAGPDARHLGLHRLKDLQHAGASVPAWHRRLPTAEDVARDEPSGSRDAVSGSRAGDRPDRRAAPQERRRPACDADGAGWEREVTARIASGRGGRRPTTTVGSGGCRWPPLAIPPWLQAPRAQALGSKDTLSAAVGDKRLLLVLDNFEHLLDAAAGVGETIGLMSAADCVCHEPRAVAPRRRVGSRRRSVARAGSRAALRCSGPRCSL